MEASVNIFVLDLDPFKAAASQCDKHVVKMTLETAQLLCSAFPKGEAPYKATHVNHPCAIWIRKSLSNASWLVQHGLALASEFRLRFGKEHKSLPVIEWCSKNIQHVLDDNGMTAFAQAMPDTFKSENAVQAYRNYYIHVKSPIASWNKGRQPPSWWHQGAQQVACAPQSKHRRDDMFAIVRNNEFWNGRGFGESKLARVYKSEGFAARTVKSNLGTDGWSEDVAIISAPADAVERQAAEDAMNSKVSDADLPTVAEVLEATTNLLKALEKAQAVLTRAMVRNGSVVDTEQAVS
jgi:hypothetical protein